MDTTKLRPYYIALAFEDTSATQQAFLAVVQKHLIGSGGSTTIITARRTSLDPTRLNELIASFLRKHGARLWPTEQELRMHYARPEVRRCSKSEGDKSLSFTFDGVMKSQKKGTWRQKAGNEGRLSRTREESMAGPRIGKLFKACLKEAMKLPVLDEVEDTDADELLRRMLGIYTEADDAQAPEDEGGDTHPDSSG